jgi:formate C-acetyltransferase
VPFIFNDDCFIKAMSDRGIAVEDARDYAPIGCVEITIPGKANPRAVSGWFNSLKCMELTLFGGMDPKSGNQIGPRTPALTEMTSFEELYKCYIIQMNFFAGNIVYGCNVQEIKQREKGPLPCLSVLTDDCIKKGRDITNGGAVYDYHSICFVGAADTADSLYAVKKMVFEDNKISASDLSQALKCNFEGHEVLRHALLGVPKYGNDIDGVDVLAKRVCDDFIDYLDKQESCCGGKFFAQLFSFVLNLGFGLDTGATPDGRYAGDPVAYSLSAHQGRDEKGITSMLKSLSCMPHNRAAAASAAIVDLTPKLVEGQAGLERMKSIIRSSLALGVGQVQFNVVTAERLQLAKENPDEYGNIPVRVAGYSQMFKLVPDELQDHIIARTKHFG